MADKKISELLEADPLDGTEDLPIVKDGVTVRCSTQDIADLPSSTEPLRYSAYVTQSSASNPSATVAGTGGNTTGATVAWTRSIAGYSVATASTAIFTSGKTIVKINGVGSGGYTDPKLFSSQIASTTVINFGAFRASDQTAEDGWAMFVEILIFP